MASAMLRGRWLWWITPPAIGLGYHMSTIKAADNVNKKVSPKDLDIYDKIEKPTSSTEKTADDVPTAFEEQISKGRKVVWKHSENVKSASDSASSGFKTFVANTKEFAKNIQTDRTLQLKTGAIAAASLTGIILAGSGRRPLRRVFFAGALGTATSAVLYPSKTSAIAKDAYKKVTAAFESKPDTKTGKFSDTPDPLRSGETLLFEEAIALSEMVYNDVRERVHVDDIHLPDIKAVCKEVVEEILLGISEDFEIQTGGFTGGKHASKEHKGLFVWAQEIVKQAVEEILEAIDEDLDIQTGGVHTGIPTIALDSTVLAKDISGSVIKALEEDVYASSIDKRSYLFSDPDKLATVVSDEYVRSVEAAIDAQVNGGRCHVILNSTSIAAKTGAELRLGIEKLKQRRAADLVTSRPVTVSDSRAVSDRVSVSLLDFINDHIKSARGDYGFSEAGHIVQKASQEATKALLETKIAEATKAIVQEVNDAVKEDIDIQSGSGFRDPVETRKPKPAAKPVGQVDADALEGIMLSPMYVPGFDHLADAVSNEIKESLHGRGVIVSEVDHMAHSITKEVLDGINEDIEIQTGGWSSPGHTPHVILSAKDLIKMAAKGVLDAIEEDMDIQTGGSMEKKRDLFLDSKRLSAKIVDSIMTEVVSDMKAGEASDEPFLFSLPQQLGKMAATELGANIEEESYGVGRHLRRIYIDVDALVDGVSYRLKDDIEENYIRAKALGELNNEREIAIVDLDEIRKKVGASLRESLEQNPLVTSRPGEEPLHVVEEVGSLSKRVVEEMTKAIQEDIDIQTGGAAGKKFSVIIDARELTKKIFHEIEEAIEEDFDIQTGKGFRPKPKGDDSTEEKPGNRGQAEASDKDMYSTRSS